MMRFDRFTERAQDAAMRAYEILQRYQHSQADTEHLFLALLETRLQQRLAETVELRGLQRDAEDKAPRVDRQTRTGRELGQEDSDTQSEEESVKTTSALTREGCLTQSESVTRDGRTPSQSLTK